MLGIAPQQQVDFSAAVNESGTRQQIRAGIGSPDSPHVSNNLLEMQQPNTPAPLLWPLRAPKPVRPVDWIWAP